MAHHCLSQSTDCSGIAPCPACAMAVRRDILPRACIQGTLNLNTEQATRFFLAFATRQQEKAAEARQSVSPTPIPSPEELAIVQQVLMALKAQEASIMATATQAAQQAVAPVVPSPSELPPGIVEGPEGLMQLTPDGPVPLQEEVPSEEPQEDILDEAVAQRAMNQMFGPPRAAQNAELVEPAEEGAPSVDTNGEVGAGH